MQDKYLPKDRDQRLFRVVEEMGELQSAIGKAGRWGMESVNPDLPTYQQETNAAWIKREIGDVRHALDAVEPDIDNFIQGKKSQETEPRFLGQIQFPEGEKDKRKWRKKLKEVSLSVGLTPFNWLRFSFENSKWVGAAWAEIGPISIVFHYWTPDL